MAGSKRLRQCLSMRIASAARFPRIVKICFHASSGNILLNSSHSKYVLCSSDQRMSYLVKRDALHMPITIRSLDNVEIQLRGRPESMENRDLASKLGKLGSLTIQKIHRDALVGVSQWLTYLHKAPWELGLVQDRFTKALRLVNGEATSSFRLGAQIGEKVPATE